MRNEIMALAAEADAGARIRASGRPYAFTTRPGHVLPQPVEGVFCHVPAEVFELSSRERRGLAAENVEAWSRPYIIRERWARARRRGDDGWGY